MAENRIHQIDGCKVFLGFDRGAAAGIALPPSVTSYSREDVDFPEFVDRFAPPAGAELIAAVCWNSVYRGHLGLAATKGMRSGHHDIRHAYFLGPSPVVRWSWLLYVLVYDHDNEAWDWFLAAATDRDIADRKDAAHWLIESFWCWFAAHSRDSATPVDEISRAGILPEPDIRELGRRIYGA
jgi:hypothetical protein